MYRNVNYLISNPTAIDRVITRARFNKSNNLRESNVTIKNIGKDRVIANFFVRNILNKKKKKAPINIFIINIRPRLAGGKKMARGAINPRIKIKNTDFFQYFPVACNIIFNYNRNLW